MRAMEIFLQLTSFFLSSTKRNTDTEQLSKYFSAAQSSLFPTSTLNETAEPLNKPSFDPKQIFSSLYELKSEDFPNTRFKVSTTGFHAQSTLKLIEHNIAKHCHVHKPWWPWPTDDIDVLVEANNHDFDALTIGLVTVHAEKDLAIFDQVDASGHRIETNASTQQVTMRESLHNALEAGLNPKTNMLLS